MNHILLVEDDPALGTSLEERLKSEGFQVSWSQDLAQARQAPQSDLIILDWMLPDGQGIDFLREMRLKNKTIPIIMLTARTDLVDKVVGLESGANDYITKPFEPRELIARIRVQMRIGQKMTTPVESSSQTIVQGPLLIDLNARLVSFEGENKDLTKMEFDLLRLLADHPRKAFSREEILNKVWGYDNYPTTRTVDTHVLQLRQKFPVEFIETVRGIGYRFIPWEDLTKN